MVKLKFWEDILPSGQITQSSNRLVFLAGWAFLFLIITANLVVHWAWGKDIDYGLIAMIASYLTGQKLYQKYLEQSGQNLPNVAFEAVKAEYKKKFGVDAPPNKTMEEITNAINTNTPLI